ncbi:arsenical resistance protein ArsH [Mesorhizobium albiziae]|uniref:Arsenical resistance protein ArsH n=1 Tax=Neomesorhizobium albiziae TaxID=335020 RepID=A0A1I4CXM5_9HYPH|nr:arsenical resistance protein ArsH [Mesorhizobium albiziae]GLS31038.1 arsenical resistance protein ArsH [Mesorhizobium albiziae]SFK84746.1 arsenical resistance protein ArsH [Mesorhizobium albiziae]
MRKDVALHNNDWMRVDTLPNIVEHQLHPIDEKALFDVPRSTHKPRILMLYGSLRERSYSRLVTEEAARILQRLGAEVQIYNPTGMPVPDAMSAHHQKVRELSDLSLWSEAHVWCSPERHGAMTDVMKAQIDWLALTQNGVHPAHGRTLAVVQISGGAQNFGRANQMRVFGRWMRIVTTPHQATIAEAVAEFDETGRMKASPYYNRIVDMMEELVKFTLLLRDRSAYLTDRYSERVESAEKLAKRVNQRSI